ncbi:MAG: transposase [Candidatus Melainabacteria bacterium]|nr:transposase [Candidatus Melainabacteria bacterium]
MARDLCIEFPNAFYHVFSRGMNRQELFSDDEDNFIFLNQCRKAVKKYQIRIFAFCLMGNHYHLYLSTPNANLARAMKFINQSYAIYFLAKYPEKDGHVFRGRYKRKIVQDDVYSKTLINYIHANPVAAGVTESLSAYPWSSYASYLQKERRLDFIDYDWVLDQFSGNLKSFAKFHQDNVDSDWDPKQEAKAQIFLADNAFIKSICDSYVDFVQLDKKPVTGLKELKSIYNQEVIAQAIRSLDYNPQTNAKLSAYLLKEYTDTSFEEIGKIINKSMEATAKCVQRFRRLLAEDKELELEIRKVVEMSNVHIRP